MKEKVGQLATLAVPELAAARATYDLVRRRRAHSIHPPSVIQPEERPNLISFGKDRVIVHRKQGIEVVTLKRAPGLSTGETILLAALGAGAYGVYLLGKTVEADLASAGSGFKWPWQYVGL